MLCQVFWVQFQRVTPQELLLLGQMFIKQAVVNAGRKLLPDKEIMNWNKNLLVQFLFLTTLKNYFYNWITQENPFVIPKHITCKAKRKKIALVLDMDETLVYTRRQTAPNHPNYITTEFKGQKMYVQPRPLARQFLKTVAEIFTVYIYTAGEKKYADSVLNIIDPDNLIEKRFYRDSCRKQNGVVIKDLKHLKRSIRSKQEMVLVDDNKYSIEKNYPFAIEIKAFEGNQEDQELLVIFQKILKFYI